MDLTKNTGSIGDGKAGPDDLTVLENSGNQALFKLQNGNLKARDIGSSKDKKLRKIKEGSNKIKEPLKWKQNQWRIISADRDEDQNIAALRHANNKKIKIWEFNNNWILTKKNNPIKVSSRQFLKQEQRFKQKLTAPLSEEDAPKPEPINEAEPPPQSTWASNEPLFRFQWGLLNDGSLAGAKENADTDAHEVFRSLLFPEQGISPNAAGRNVIAVIDTGVNLEHQDITNNLLVSEDVVDGIDNDGNGYIDDVFGYDFHNDDFAPIDDHGHGTHVAGIAAAEANGTGIVGINPVARILPIKVFDETGTGSTANIIRGINYAVNKGAKVINLSLGIENPDPALEMALLQAQTTGALIVTAAGNDSRDIDQIPQYPAGFDLANIITVGSSDIDDSISSFSNTGAKNVDLLAPGSLMYSSWIGSPTAIKGYQGTSMATGMVSGAITSAWARNPQLTATEVKQQLLASVDPLGFNDKVLSGGRLNIARLMGIKPEDKTATSKDAAITSATGTEESINKANRKPKPSYNRKNLKELTDKLNDEIILFIKGKNRSKRKTAINNLKKIFDQHPESRKEVFGKIDNLSGLDSQLAIASFTHDTMQSNKTSFLENLLRKNIINGVELSTEGHCLC